MSENQRRLLPYEHQLIETLGISKEEYLDFVAQQHIYSDIKEGSVLDARNWPVVAIVLTVVGVLFQVAAILLAPKPQIPQARSVGGQPATRDDIFAPRFGFNSAQQLAAYGDPVNLVYTNKGKGRGQNPNGGVRVATSLIWSAVKSYGTSQYVQLLFVNGAGGLHSIDLSKSAFGQVPLRDLVAQNFWTYFKEGATGQLRNDYLLPPVNGIALPDPSNAGTEASNPYQIRKGEDGTHLEGFSHAYSPSASASFGAYGVVPINVDYGIRNSSGDFEWASILVSVSPPWSDGRSRTVRAGDTRTVTLAAIESTQSSALASAEVNELRLTLSNVFDEAGVFKLGSAEYKVVSVDRSTIIGGAMQVKLVCIEPGKLPKVGHDTTRQEGVNVLAIYGQNARYRELRQMVNVLVRECQRSNNAQELLASGEIVELKFINTQQHQMRGSNFSGIFVQYRRVRKLKSAERNLLQEFINLEAIDRDLARKDDFFYTKALTRIETASYETVSPCNIVDFSIKARVFKRVSGRQSEYGSERRSGWSVADNGIKRRSAMFIVRYKKTASARYITMPGIFVVSRPADIENFIYLRFDSGTTGEALAANWQFSFKPVIDPFAEFDARRDLVDASGLRRFYYLENTGPTVNVKIGNGPESFEYKGTLEVSEQGFPPINQNPGGMNEWDLFTNTSDSQVQFSFDNGPELALAAVTEQIVEPYSSFPSLYSNLSLTGLNMYSGKTIQDLRSFTLFVDQGRKARSLSTSTLGALSSTANECPCNAPDIFVDTVLDKQDGIGKYASVFSLDLEQLSRSKLFCQVNKLFMDGIIAEPTSWRAFWASTAGFSLLELAKIGGRETLIPAVPYDPSTGKITDVLKVSALFNQGNILEDSYREEFVDYGGSSQDIIAKVIYRNADADYTFFKNTTVDVRLADTIEEYAIQQDVDLSQFVSNREQAVLVGKFLCLSKRHSRRSIEFKTFPTDSPVFPGAYIHVELTQSSWQRIYSGIIEENGVLNCPFTIPSGTYAALCYKHGTKTTLANPAGVQHVSSAQVIIRDDGKNQSPDLADYSSCLFVLGNSVLNKRVFRVTEVEMDEEGEVTIRAVEHPTDGNGKSLIAQGMIGGSWSVL